ncbi:MAG: hypothetical protein CVU56_28585 [Deltaproteobacteria bacterium HGW-Deltaproteobacteria-14]|jgi:hypothetical protein|nr:MAG: hypothetical protein CVU56_28585 [Deltaproteobacteria bacterium HGW-Deltaproteobacteria-14]
MGFDLDPRAELALARSQLSDPRAAGFGRRGDEPDLAEVATQFEALLMKQLVVAMRDSVKLGGDSEPNVMTEHLIEDALATHLAQSGGVGLAEVIIRDAEGPPRPNHAVFGGPGLGLAAPAVHDAAEAPDSQLVSDPTSGSLADRLPPDRDAWLDDDDAAGTLRRLIGAPAKKIDLGP